MSPRLMAFFKTTKMADVCWACESDPNVYICIDESFGAPVNKGACWRVQFGDKEQKGGNPTKEKGTYSDGSGIIPLFSTDIPDILDGVAKSLRDLLEGIGLKKILLFIALIIIVYFLLKKR